MTFHRRGLEIGPFDLLGLTINPTFHWYGLIIVYGHPGRRGAGRVAGEAG